MSDVAGNVRLFDGGNMRITLFIVLQHEASLLTDERNRAVASVLGSYA